MGQERNQNDTRKLKVGFQMSFTSNSVIIFKQFPIMEFAFTVIRNLTYIYIL